VGDGTKGMTGKRCHGRGNATLKTVDGNVHDARCHLTFPQWSPGSWPMSPPLTAGPGNSWLGFSPRRNGIQASMMDWNGNSCSAW